LVGSDKQYVIKHQNLKEIKK